MFNPQLPPEIWREIFEVATYVPRLLDNTWDYSPSEELWRGWSDSYRDTALHTRRSILSVCRFWRAIGLEFLWEVVEIPEVEASEENEPGGVLDRLKAQLTPSVGGYGR